ncbi:MULTISPECIES: MlaD family protein [unclassified Saccharibacter]|uniref:PqiB family protein n=1 Tax=unclassified Saccharibacter TaxID=2648722 RepID=UPI001326FE3D|nr:MCE family protein [Saccharibacter sp. EH611]MXV58213.1 MCE family protein [Saccharibacter sp. EH70]MXV65669.1 MCE family protein [Saccharibacter sp. EH60]
MSDKSPKTERSSPQEAHASLRPTRFSILWIIPVLAVAISGWLVWEHFSTQGPLITISFDTADGLVPGQTQVKNKAVTLGVVQSVDLSADMSHADVTVQMNGGSENLLTHNARFWVVRPRVNGTSITGLDTLLSGAYIALDPGAAGGPHQRFFKGLENPPGVRSDQPGSTYWLVAPRLESLGSGAPVFFRDLQVGEVLGYTMPQGGEGPILLQVFVRAPYDHYLKVDSRFWNVSGMQVGFGAGGLQVRLQSLQTLFSGGLAFGRSSYSRGVDAPEAEANAVFRLYDSPEEADNTRYRQRVRVATYVDSSIGGLTEGSKVTMFGVQVGIVTGVHLELDTPRTGPRVRVDMQIEPGRVAEDDNSHSGYSQKILSDFVARGLHASVQNASFLTGESMVALGFTHSGKPGELHYENGVAILPNEPGGMDGILQSVSTVADKVSNMPLEQIGDHINALLADTDERVRSPQLTQSMIALQGSLSALNRLMDHADEHLPALLNNMNTTIEQARTLMAAYSGDTDFHRNLGTLVQQLTQASRSIHQLTQYLDHHPSALITGRRH